MHSSRESGVVLLLISEIFIDKYEFLWDCKEGSSRVSILSEGGGEIGWASFHTLDIIAFA
jgi:hypothetical protein